MALKEHDHMQNDAGAEGQTSLLGVQERIMRIQHPFLHALASISGNHGYEGGVFTGAGLCAVAAYALFDGIKAWMDPAFSLGVKGMHIFMNKEYVGGVGLYKEAFGFHSILEVVHPNEEAIYVDSTHGQLNKAWAGKFLFSPALALGNWYKTTDEGGLMLGWRYGNHKRPITAFDLYDVTDQKEKQLAYFEKTLGITRPGFNRLVSSVRGGI